MPTCPNCGEIVMNGDPYCTHCGATLRWDHDEDEFEERPLPIVLNDLEMARRAYDRGDYSNALTFIMTAASYYKLLNGKEKARVGANPFNQDWVVETCCNVYNLHDSSIVSIANFIRDNNILINICNDCSCVFPYHYTECTKCGKPFDPVKQDVDKVRKQIGDILRRMFVSDYHILMLTEKSISLIESNDCSLYEIRKDYDAIIFTFKKEHRYFYTEYECIYLEGYFRQDRVFYDCMMRNNHDKLLRNDSFKRLIKVTEEKTGFKFRNCGGGYTDPDFDIVTEDFTFNNRYRLFANFDIDERRTATYVIDLDRMELSEDYTVYD